MPKKFPPLWWFEKCVSVRLSVCPGKKWILSLKTMNKFELMAVKTPSKMPSAELFWQFYNYCFIARELDSFKGTIEHHLPHWFSDHCKFWKNQQNLTYPNLMLCLNSLTRGLCPLGPLQLPERPISTIRNGWGKFCSISPIKYSVCLPVYSCLKTKLNLQNWSYTENFF